MASAHPTPQPEVPELDHDNLSRLELMYPDNLIWRWAGEPELVLQNGDKLFAACIRPKEEGNCHGGGPGASFVGDKEGLLEVGECCAFKFTTHESQPVGLITRLYEQADSLGQVCSKVVIYKPFMKLSRLPETGMNIPKSSLLETAAIMCLTEDEALLLCSHERRTFLQDVIFPVTVRNSSLHRIFCAQKASEDHDKPSYCCLGLYNQTKLHVKLKLDEDFCLKDYLVPELPFETNSGEPDVMDEWIDEDEI